MASAAQRIADLERQVAELADEVKNLRETAIALGILNELREMRAEAGHLPGAPSRRPRHLHVARGATALKPFGGSSVDPNPRQEA